MNDGYDITLAHLRTPRVSSAAERPAQPAPVLPSLCLSIRQPWAWLVVHGWKNIENRTWSTSIRGPTLVHAGQRLTQADYDACRLFVAGISATVADLLPRPADLPLGGIVGRTAILGCVTSHSSLWFCGPYGFVLDPDQSRPLPFQPCPGHLGFFRVPEEVR